LEQLAFASDRLPIILGADMKKLILAFTSIALAIASAAAPSYRIKLFQPSVIAGTELKPGEYKIELEGEKAVLKSGKNVVETKVKVETADQKFAATTVRYSNGDGKYHVQEIRLGGTNKKLIFEN
jgi:hypothetical protein